MANTSRELRKLNFDESTHDPRTLSRKHLNNAKALRFHAWPNFGRKRPERLGVFPYPLKNPFLPLMFADVGFEALALPSLWRGLRLVRRGHADGLHIQFENQMERRTRFDPNLGTEATYARLQQELLAYKAAGHQFAWTVHDAESHYDSSFPEHLTAIRTFLAREASLIHVFNAAGARYAKQQLGADPERVEIIAHPSYFGAYTPLPEIAPPPPGRRFLCFGTILPFKGIEDFLRRSGEVDIGASLGKITVAGPFWPDTSPDVKAAAPGNREVDFRFGFVPDADVAAIFSETDFVVVNYRRVLTSGVVTLAMTMGRPIIGTNIGGISEAVPPEIHQLLYDPEDLHGLERVIHRACSMTEEEHVDLQKKCRDFALKTHPVHQSHALERALRNTSVLPKI